jgi:hypothetical protein
MYIVSDKWRLCLLYLQLDNYGLKNWHISYDISKIISFLVAMEPSSSTEKDRPSYFSFMIEPKVDLPLPSQYLVPKVYFRAAISMDFHYLIQSAELPRSTHSMTF